MENWLQKAKKQGMADHELQKPEIRLFNNIVDTGRFLIFDFFHYPNPENKTGVCIWKRMYSLIGLSKEEVEGVRETMGKQHYHIACKSNTIVDQFLAEAFEQMVGKVKTKIPNPEDFDVIIVSDFVCEIYFSALHKENWKKSWKTPKKMDEFDLEKTLKIMHTPYTTRLIIYHDLPEPNNSTKKCSKNSIHKNQLFAWFLFGKIKSGLWLDDKLAPLAIHS